MDAAQKNHLRLRSKLREAGVTFAQIARELGVSPATVTIVSQGHRRSHNIQTAIAGHLGTTPQNVFPDRYSKKEGPADVDQ
ncbi:MAG: helix-turn-helix domain-containing protein [Rhodobacterales bacterium]|nr:helix-turn-helix domain-containing protein [Rhodobacterales bacterium]